jgi:hypothetical protein
VTLLKKQVSDLEASMFQQQQQQQISQQVGPQLS